MKLLSKAFKDKGSIPKLYTCQGKNISPPLEISGVPPKAKSLVLLMEDPDVPLTLREEGLYIHWVVFNINPTLIEIEEEATPFGILGKNTAGKSAYTGPCPPDRQHRYFFKLYALDEKLRLKEGSTRDEVLEHMEGHILAKTELMGLYVKS